MGRRGWAQLALMLALADAAAWAPLFKSLQQQHHPAMGSGGVLLEPAGQKFSGTEAGASGRVQLHAGSEDGREHFCLLGWAGLVFFPPSSPFKWLPCQPSAVQNFCATSEVGFWLSWHISFWFVKSQNHRMGEVIRDHT